MQVAQIANLVASAQRRSGSRHEAHLLLCADIEAMDLDSAEETALRDAAYRRLFPEHAHVLACSDPDDGAIASRGGSDA